MTLSDYRAAVRRKIDDSAYEQAVVDEAINWYVKEVCSRTRLRFLETSDDISIAAGDTEVEFPDDMDTLINLSVTSPTPGRNIMRNFIEYDQFVINNPDYLNVNSQPVASVDWTDYANQMRLAAPASEATTLLCEYLVTVDDMTEDDDECVISDTYNKMVTLGATAEVMERNEDYGEAASERKKLSALETIFISNEGRGRIKVGPTVMNTRRGRRSGQWRADRDFNGG